jgi:hypothetical protein
MAAEAAVHVIYVTHKCGFKGCWSLITDPGESLYNEQLVAVRESHYGYLLTL